MRYKFQKDRTASLISRMIFREFILSQNYSPEIMDQWEYNEYKKPYIPTWEYSFNISHSKELVAVAFALSDVGMDVEKYKKLDYPGFGKVFSNEELDVILKDPEQSEKRFFQYWSLKEAVMKLEGKGFYLSPKEILIRDNQCYCENKEKHFQNLELVSGYSTAVAMNEPFEVETKRINHINDFS